MTLTEINKTYGQLLEDYADLKIRREALLNLYDTLNRPLPDGIKKMIVEATENSERYLELLDGFRNRVNSFSERLVYAGYSAAVAEQMVKGFRDFLKGK